MLDIKDGETKECFVVAPIGDDGSDTRKRSDQVLKHVIRPAVESCGYRATRADEIDKPGLITTQVIQRVVSDPLVVADLTGMNPNVFYELAIRHAIKRPLVQIIQKGERIPFDVAGTRTIYVDHHDLDSVSGAKNEIVGHIRELEKAPQSMETPISIALDLQVLRQSENPEDRTAAETISVLTSIQAAMIKVQEAIENGRGDISRTILERLDVIGHELRDPDSFPRTRTSGRQLRVAYELMFRSSARMSREFADETRWIILSSLVRDSMPWMYEATIEVVRQLQSGSRDRTKKAIATVRNLFELTTRDPETRDIVFRNKDSSLLIEMIERALFESSAEINL